MLKKTLAVTLASVMILSMALSAGASSVTQNGSSGTYNGFAMFAGVYIPVIDVSLPTFNSASFKLNPFSEDGKQIISPVYEFVNFSDSPIRLSMTKYDVKVASDAISKNHAAADVADVIGFFDHNGFAIDAVTNAKKISIGLRMGAKTGSGSGLIPYQDATVVWTPAWAPALAADNIFVPAIQPTSGAAAGTLGAVQTKTPATAVPMGTMLRGKNDLGKQLTYTKNENKLLMKFDGKMAANANWSSNDKISITPTFKFEIVGQPTGIVEVVATLNTGANLFAAAQTAVTMDDVAAYTDETDDSATLTAAMLGIELTKAPAIGEKVYIGVPGPHTAAKKSEADLIAGLKVAGAYGANYTYLAGDGRMTKMQAPSVAGNTYVVIVVSDGEVRSSSTMKITTP